MYPLKSVFIFLVAFVSTFLITNYFIKKFKEKGFTVKDMYKPEKPQIPTMGGLAILCGLFVSLIASQMLLPLDQVEKLLILYFVIFVYGLFGLIDDLLELSRFSKLVLPFFLALPIALLNIDTRLDFFTISIELGWVFKYIIAPLYVMVVANLINMHSGYNGLSGGLATILLIFVGLESYLKNINTPFFFYLIPMLGVMLAFMWFNKYPSKIFLGNSGTLLVGSAVGSAIILNNLEIFGVVILIPHIINFLLWIYWCIKKYPHVKFAKVQLDGAIKPPNKLTLKYLVAHYFKVRELRAILILYGITTIFGVLGLILI